MLAGNNTLGDVPLNYHFEVGAECIVLPGAECTVLPGDDCTVQPGDDCTVQPGDDCDGCNCPKNILLDPKNENNTEIEVGKNKDFQ